MQVLYRFLEFFSNFDWDNFCVSLWGPVPISSLPDVTGNLLQNCCLVLYHLIHHKLLANFLGLMFSYWKYFTAKPPRQDSEELLLSKLFLDYCSAVYAVFPGGQENQGQPFIPKHFNVIDPLRVNNNLGRSVSKGIQTFLALDLDHSLFSHSFLFPNQILYMFGTLVHLHGFVGYKLILMHQN